MVSREPFMFLVVELPGLFSRFWKLCGRCINAQMSPFPWGSFWAFMHLPHCFRSSGAPQSPWRSRGARTSMICVPQMSRKYMWHQGACSKHTWKLFLLQQLCRRKGWSSEFPRWATCCAPRRELCISSAGISHPGSQHDSPQATFCSLWLLPLPRQCPHCLQGHRPTPRLLWTCRTLGEQRRWAEAGRGLWEMAVVLCFPSSGYQHGVLLEFSPSSLDEIFYWSIVDLQICGSFWSTANWLHYICCFS